MLKELFSKKAAPAIEHAFFPITVRLGGATLSRNGTGTRSRMMVKVYNGALYLPTPTTSAAEALSMRGPKQLRFVALHDLGGNQLAASLLSGIRNNAQPGQETRQMAQIDEVLKVFRSQDKIAEGGTFRIDLLPDEGAFFFIDEQLKGAPIKAPDFNEAVLSIWLGSNPADLAMKSALLGQERAG